MTEPTEPLRDVVERVERWLEIWRGQDRHGDLMGCSYEKAPLYARDLGVLSKLPAELDRHVAKLNDALGIVGAEEDIDPYEAVVALHTEVDRLREELAAAERRREEQHATHLEVNEGWVAYKGRKVKERREFLGQIAELARERDEARAELADYRKKLNDWGDDRARLRAERDRLRSALAGAVTEWGRRWPGTEVVQAFDSRENATSSVFPGTELVQRLVTAWVPALPAEDTQPEPRYDPVEDFKRLMIQPKPGDRVRVTFDDGDVMEDTVSLDSYYSGCQEVNSPNPTAKVEIVARAASGVSGDTPTEPQAEAMCEEHGHPAARCSYCDDTGQVDETESRFPYRQFPHQFAGSDTERQQVGDPGYCEDCVSVGHVKAHPELGCGDVGRTQAHGEDVPGSAVSEGA